jgi:acetyl esterase/lipase
MPVVEDRTILTLDSPAPDRQIRYGDDPLHVADVWSSRPAPGGPLILLIHGGFWRPAFDRKHLAPFANAIADTGLTVASIEYRREPGSPDLTIEDVSLACARLPRALEAQDDRAVVVGHSAGGHLALWCASAVAASALSIVALAPAASLTMAESLNLGSGAVQAFLGVAATSRPDLDPYERPSATVPITIIHGTADETVPVSVAEHYQRRHSATRLVKLEDVGHFALIDPRTNAWSTVIAEIRRLAGNA